MSTPPAPEPEKPVKKFRRKVGDFFRKVLEELADEVGDIDNDKEN